MSSDGLMTYIELGREKVSECFTKRIECKNYWNAHGKPHYMEPSVYIFDQPKRVELYQVHGKYICKYTPDFEVNFFDLYVDGVPLSCGEIIEYQPLKTKVKLLCCVGSG